MIKFDLIQFLNDLPISLPALAQKLGVKYRGLCVMRDRGTIKPEVYSLLKKKFPVKTVEKYRLFNVKF